MPYPAYQGYLFFFDIVVGHAWHHDFPPVIDRNIDAPMDFSGAWVATCVIRDNTGTELATLNNAGTGDGTITLTAGRIALDLSAAFTAGLPPTTSYRPGPSKSFVWADLSLTDPLAPTEPYIAARGKGVIYLPTTVG